MLPEIFHTEILSGTTVGPYHNFHLLKGLMLGGRR